MGTGMSKVLDGLYLGNIRDSQDKDNLVKNGVSHVLSICHNAKPVLEAIFFFYASLELKSRCNTLPDVGDKFTVITCVRRVGTIVFPESFAEYELAR
ncbi:hypothetical protein scyTo_0011112 [Scyliorhinus torazame]|uniref:Uncharacterized protein n=1 Tax=Scyliorhinus torazame TaxID=75743 RepID=A0A401NHF6_SCYTO|nr:hypothetical protein [Scyliorhinus torazame]